MFRRCVSNRKAPYVHSAFTLVELLVVIAIIGILIALLLPAVQAAREAGRLTECKNNLKQMGLGFQNHISVHKHVPTGGWGWRWTGDPDRGFGKGQPGGFAYNLLPFMGETALRNLGKNQSGTLKNQALGRQVATFVKGFLCPSRRSELITYPMDGGGVNFTGTGRAARMDYAACAGGSGPAGSKFAGKQNVANDVEGENTVPLGPGPDNNQAAIDAYIPSPNYCENINHPRYASGVIYSRSTLRIKQIPDGLSKTYAIGEKFLLVDQYGTGDDPADNEWMFVGYDNDTARSATDIGDGLNANVMRDGRSETVVAGRTLGGNQALGRNLWGSAHPAAFAMLFCDGSVHTIPFTIDLKTHRQLGNRLDGETPVFDF